MCEAVYGSDGANGGGAQVCGAAVCGGGIGGGVSRSEGARRQGGGGGASAPASGSVSKVWRFVPRCPPHLLTLLLGFTSKK